MEAQAFDLRTHIRDEKSGALIRKQPYTLYTHEGVQLFERPRGSGNLYFKGGEEAGRWDAGKWKKDVEHIAYKPPQTEDDRLRNEVIAAREKVAHMERELEAIRRDKKYGAQSAAKETK